MEQPRDGRFTVADVILVEAIATESILKRVEPVLWSVGRGTQINHVYFLLSAGVNNHDMRRRVRRRVVGPWLRPFAWRAAILVWRPAIVRLLCGWFWRAAILWLLSGWLRHAGRRIARSGQGAATP